MRTSLVLFKEALMPRALDVPGVPAGWRDFRMLRMSKMTDYGIVLLAELARAGSGTRTAK